MNKITLSLAVSLLIISCSVKDKELPVPPILVNKTVTFSINPLHDYTHTFYTGATAEIKLSIYKQYSEPYSVAVIWDTVFARQELKNYMQMPVPNVISKTFSNLDESKYRVGISYSVSTISAPPFSANTFSAMGELLPLGNHVSPTVNVPL